jgi:hypothetical protein
MNANRRSLRGRITENVAHRIILDDGMYTHGYKIVEFYVWKEPTSTNNDVYGTLALQSSFANIMDAGDNLQIAWASSYANGTASLASPFSIIDPNHIVNRDLYIQTQVGGAGGSEAVNYLVIIEPVTMTEPQAVLQLIKERAQDDLR